MAYADSGYGITFERYITDKLKESLKQKKQTFTFGTVLSFARWFLLFRCKTRNY